MKREDDVVRIDEDRALGSLLGLACGDAVGTTVEFCSPGTFAPLTGMTGGGPFHLATGQWTDDTSMALCLAESLIERGGFDARDQMERYVRWWRHGHLSPTGDCFDIGNTVRAALQRFVDDGNPFAGSTSSQAAGNGSIMRLAPAAIFFAPHHEAAIHFAGESSRTTHGARTAVDACRLLADRLLAALAGAGKEEVLFRPFRTVTGAPLAAEIQSIADGAWRDEPRERIRGTGYVVEALQAALWCLHRTDNFRDAILLAANLGDDADTTAAVCGQLAGAHYGRSGIPDEWIEKLAMRERIEDFARCLADAAPLPFRRCYWVKPGAVMAGAYPGDADADASRAKVRGLLRCGIRTFVNLTAEDADSFRPYDTDVADQADSLGLNGCTSCLHFPVPDLGIPTPAQLVEILRAIDASLARRAPVYIHCWGGRGRTGVIVGRFLRRHGHATAADVVEKIRVLRRNDASGGSAPETAVQLRCVREEHA